jgi:hypothetical protein
MDRVGSRDFDSFERPILCIAFTVDLADRSWDTFVAETKKGAVELVGSVTEQEIEKGVELRGGFVCLNSVFSQMGLS